MNCDARHVGGECVINGEITDNIHAACCKGQEEGDGGFFTTIGLVGHPHSYMGVWNTLHQQHLRNAAIGLQVFLFQFSRTREFFEIRMPFDA
jgi:hypothetical protein